MSRYGERTRIGEAVSALGRKPDEGIGYGVATGGTSSSITVSGQAYTLLTFTSTGTLTVTKAGLFDVMGGGGGAAGSRSEYGGGGGGAGSIWDTTIYLDADETITIGAGGAKNAGYQSRAGLSGSPSTVGTKYTAVGGGFGGSQDSPIAGSGGSGGGSGYRTVPTASTIGLSIDGFGFNGGQSGTSNGYPNGGGGGGGGAGAVGGNGSGNNGGAGGAGRDISAFRGEVATTTIRGGGGGGGTDGGTAGAAGSGGGSAGNAGTAAAVNQSGGGGGGGLSSASPGDSANGGSGFVLVRFKV